ncbi:IclR family transcriptional regulator [Streptomyces castrisilvae]|uniref:IclR family transcriptional regulator n=1 Tax=Streptomyces castrisilvae TaxID=3033811 RepID=A0ABY9HUD8_9ACTN|nr:IclR family transcriptional regulator [Streptomyces sp. Mut1]WLQ38198.1 IclR family transcriptional regulator [Streptomyces sp. Mut1]
MRILRVIAAHLRGMSLQQLHEELGIPIGSLHRVMAALVAERYVTRSPSNRRYFIGPAFSELSTMAVTSQGTAVSPPRPMEEVAKESGETVFLTELTGSRLLCVALVEGIHPLRLFVRVGQDMPPHAAASARSILAYQTPETVAMVLREQELTAYTTDTPHTAGHVTAHLVQVRMQGFDVCENELDDDVWAVSAPVFGSTGQTTSSITLAAAGQRMRDPLARTRATESVLRAARALSMEHGYVASTSPTLPRPSPEPAG